MIRKKSKRVINKRTIALLLFAILVTSGLLVYNSDHLYSMNHSRLSAVLPSDYSGGETVTFPVLVSDVNGNPRSRSEVRVYLVGEDETDLLYRGYTSSDGICEVEVQMPDEDFQGELLVEGASETITKKISVIGQNRLFVSTDKPIYQPGQTVHIRSLAFVDDRPLDIHHGMTYTITTPENDRIFRKTLYPNEYGIAWYNYSLSDLLPLGTYELEVRALDKTVKQAFLVQEYVLPKIRIDYRGLNGWYLHGDTISGTLEANYFFGRNTEGYAEIELYAGEEVVDFRSGYLQDGQMPFMMDIPGWMSYVDHVTLNATVTDTSGHMEWKTVDIPVSKDELQFELVTSKNVDGFDSDYIFKVTYPDGSPVEGLTVNGQLGDNDLGGKITGDSGLAIWNHVYNGEDTFKITTHYNYNTYSHDFLLESGEGIKLLPMPGGNNVGDIKEFLVYYRGTSLSNRVYYTLQTERRVLYSSYITMDEEPARISIPVVYEMAPKYRLNVYCIESDLTYSTDSVNVNVDTDEYLNLRITKDKDIYQPREESVISFQVEKEGVPAAAALEVKITDEALYSLHHLSGLDRILVKETTDGEERGFEVISVGVTQEEVEYVKELWVHRYLSSLMILGFILFIGLLFAGLKYGSMAPISLVIALIIITAIPAIYVDTSEPPSGRIASYGGAPADATDEDRGGFSPPLSPPSPPTESASEETEEAADSAKPREHFPETWYWHPSLITGPDGKAELSLTTPDSITNWLVEGVASTLSGDMTGSTMNLTVFKDFFIEPDIPVSTVRNDTFTLRVIVYNYLEHEVESNVVLEAGDWYVLHDARHKTVELESGEVGNVTYRITPMDVGEHTLKIRASVPSGSTDAVYRNMRVKPDGRREVDVLSGQLTDNDISTVSFSSASEDVIPGSESAYIKIFGSMDAVTLDSAEGFIRQVRGCGEQSMSTFSINVLAYDIAVNSENPPENMEHYEKLVVQGVQHQLGFLKEANNGEGRGIVWFPRDDNVHPWLTSWGLIAFQDAIDAGLTIDEDIILDMQRWVVSQQKDDGSWEFPEWKMLRGHEIDAKKLATTAYVTRALLHSGYNPHSNAVQEGISYIKEYTKNHWDDPYILSLSALCMKMAEERGDDYLAMLQRIDELKIEDGDLYYWESGSSMIQGTRGARGSKTIETTGYAIMALTGEGYGVTTNGGVHYLLNNRNEFGTFFTTQDTVVALLALKGTGDIEIENMDIHVSMNDEYLQSISIDEENSDLTFYVDLRENLQEENTVNIETEGSGKISYQVIHERYIRWEVEDNIDISLNVDAPLEIQVGDDFTLSIEIAYGGNAQYTKMAILAIPIPTAFVSLNYDHLLEYEHISNWEVEDGELRIYLTDLLDNVRLNFDIVLIPSLAGEVQLQGIRYYDMYSPDIEVYQEPMRISVTEKTL